MSAGHVFMGGVPLGPDVRRMIDLFLGAAPGTTLTNEALAASVELDVRSSRFERVRLACRRELMRAHNIDTESVPGLGVRVLPEGDRAGASARTYRRGVRAIGRSVARVCSIRVEQLSEPEQKTATHVRRVLESTYSAAKTSTKELAVALTPPTALPRGR